MQKYKKCICVLLFVVSIAMVFYHDYERTDGAYNWFLLTGLHSIAIFSGIQLFQNKTFSKVIFCAVFILTGVYFVCDISHSNGVLGQKTYCTMK